MYFNFNKAVYYALNALFFAIIATGVGSAIINAVQGGKTERIRVYSVPEPTITYATSSVLFVGDIMLDRAVRNRKNAFGGNFPFTHTAQFISSFDLAVANLEGPITTYPSKTVDYSNKVLQFTFPPESADHLARVGFDVISIANNHGLDFGSEGIRQTLHYATSSGLAVFGDPRNDRNLSYQTILPNGATLALIGFHQFAGNYTNVANEITRIRTENNDAIIIVFPHWGEEYQTKPTNFQQAMAERWINLGADMIIGHHPHVIQEKGEYMGKPIYYSLGNFIFDQDFSVETQTGLALGVLIVCKEQVNTDGTTMSECFIPPKSAGGIQEYVVSIVKSEPRIISGTAIPVFVEKLLD